MTVDRRPPPPSTAQAVLVLPGTLTPTWWQLPRLGWVLARAFSPHRGNALLAAAGWLPWTGQLVAARCYRGAAVWAGEHARAVAVLHASRQQRAAVVAGAIGGIAALAALALAAALAYLHLVDVTSLAGAAPIALPVAVLYTAAGTTLWSARHNLAQHQPTIPGTVRIDTLAAWPSGHGAGLRHLGAQLCELADTQHVTLDLTARTPTLAERYNPLGFTQPHPNQLRLVRPPR